MVDDVELWASTVGAWPMLSKLPATIGRVLGIPKSDAIPVLRPTLESGFIHAQVLGWSEPSSDWVWTDRIDDPERLSTEGWQHVDWKDGTQAGHPIRVRWDHVQQELATLTARAQRERRQRSQTAAATSATKSAGAAPPRHDWDAFWIEVALYAAKHDLEVRHRPELQAHMVAWAASTSPKPPDDATIRSRLARLFKAVAANDSSTSENG
jgi:hypothetical protein